MLKRAAGLVKNEGQDVAAILLTLTYESSEIGLECDLQCHVTLGSGHLELHGTSSLARGLGKVEGDVGEGEAEGDLLFLDGAGAEEREGLRCHGHGQVHGGDAFVVNHDEQLKQRNEKCD